MILTSRRCWSLNMPTNDRDLNQPEAHDPHVRDADHPGYEVTDVNAGGVAVFLAGRFCSVFFFFLLLYGLGVLINGGVKKGGWRACKWDNRWWVGGAGRTHWKGEDLGSQSRVQERG